MNTEVNFIRGLHGMGVVIQITYDTSRVIFDFGEPFDPLAQIYDGTVLPRKENRLKDALLLKKAPMVHYVYRKQDLKDFALESSEDSPYTTAIFISHCHLDHMSDIDKVDPAIPVYLHNKGVALKKALEEIGEDTYYRDYSGFEYEQTFDIGCIKVTPYFSDHACIGSAGFLIETPDSRIVYSGDIRFHALEYERAYQEIEKYNKNIDLLIVDSTTTSPSEFVFDQQIMEQYKIPSKEFLKGTITEEGIYNDVRTQIKDYNGLAIFNLYHRDIRMLENMIQIAKENGRIAVFEPATAYIINSLLNIQVHVIYPNIETIPSYYKAVQANNIEVTKEEIIAHPESYYIQNSYRNILELIDFEHLPAKYFHLFGVPLTVKEKHYAILQNVLNKLNFQYFSYINLYSFSHAYPNNLAYYVQQVNAKAVVSVHSKKPESLNPVNSKHYLPKEQTDYLLINGQLIEKQPVNWLFLFLSVWSIFNQ